jgi:methylthioribulose-1-phosphate dehydratase
MRYVSKKGIFLSILLCSADLMLAKMPMTIEQAADEIVHAGAFLHQYNLCPATSGNLSIRIDENLMAITVSGKHKGELRAEDIMLVDLQGIPQNSTKKPSAETLLHTVVYSLYENAGALLHTHTLNGTVLSRLVPESKLILKGYELQKAFSGITTHESELIIPIFENSQNMASLSLEIAEYLKNNPNTYGFLLRGHGLYTWGRDMNEAKIRIEAFEYLFQCELLMRSLHR